jgi:hypothetical protein
MNERDKRRRRRRGFMDGPDEVLSLGSIYRATIFGNERSGEMAREGHAEVNPIAWPDPGEDLDDSELSDYERRQAIARERMRREGRD